MKNVRVAPNAPSFVASHGYIDDERQKTTPEMPADLQILVFQPMPPSFDGADLNKESSMLKQFEVTFTVYKDATWTEAVMSSVTTIVSAFDYGIAGDLIRNMYGRDRVVISFVRPIG